jgi:DDE superfamily endonuclease
LVRVEVKALACELPASSGVPLSRWSAAEVAREAIERGLVAEISGSTVWRWLSEEAIRPFYHRSWIFPRDPDFAHKGGRVLDLYEGNWEGEPLGPEEYVVSADEKTSIQARNRCHPTLPTTTDTPMRVEHGYERKGALAYLAAWDVHRAKLFGRCEPKNGIEPFARLVDEVMREEPYASAERVFWIVDNGSSHRGERSVKRLEGAWPNLRLVHLPTHASWLNQIEIYFSIVQRKVLAPNDFADLEVLGERLIAFQQRYERVAEPFAWKFTRRDLDRLLTRLAEHQLPCSSSAAAA